MTTDNAALPELLTRLPEAVNAWPWIAFLAIFLILAAISTRGRRPAPYGV
jgi:hypothetical protein